MIHLWHHFLQDDLDAFRQLLADATISSGPQRASGYKAGSSPALPSTSPKTSIVNKKKSGEITIKSGRPPRKPDQNSQQAIIITRADVNTKDAFGRTLLHHAASSPASSGLGFVEALLQIALVDLYIQDLENGWTPLHRALYHGHIRIAQSLMLRDVSDHAGYVVNASHQAAGGLIKIKDHEGLTPFELFALTISPQDLQHSSLIAPTLGSEDASSTDSAEVDDSDTASRVSRGPSASKGNISGDEVFAFGSNKNLSLGLGDEDDRQFPEQVTFSRPEQLLRRLHVDVQARRAKQFRNQIDSSASKQMTNDGGGALPATVVHHPFLIQDVVMSKLHTAVITADPESNVYISGYGPGGRLGTGDESTRFHYVCLQTGGLSRKRIVDVALGQDHSIAVSEQGEVFTWGSNKWGQLGYALPQSPSHSKGDPRQLTPRQLYGSMKKEIIIGAAASSLHSAIFTSSAIYTFGKNEGQLGLMDADARSLDVQTLPRRVGVSILQSPILLVSAIDRATVLLLESREVMVLTHYGWTKLVFPLDGLASPFLRRTAAVRSQVNEHDRGRTFISKITSGGNTICAMSAFGDVFAVDVSKKADPSGANQSTTNPSKARNALPPPSALWSTGKSRMAARDVAVGQDGSIILCTVAGSVWRKEKRAKIRQVNLQGMIIRKSDYKFARIPGLNRAVAVRSNAYGAYTAVRKDCDVTRRQIVVDPPSIWDTFFTMLPFRSLASSGDNGSDTGGLEFRFWTPSTPISSPSHVKQAVWRSDDVERQVGSLMRQFQPLTESHYDLWITSTTSDVRIPVHSFLVKARSPVLRHALADFQKSYYFSIPDVLCVEYGSDGQVHLRFQRVDFLTMLNYVLYLYTETVVDVWHHTQRRPRMTSRYRQIRTDLIRIGNQLAMGNLERAARVMTEPGRCLHLDMEVALRDPDFFTDTDVLILLANEAEIPAHRELLSRRCPFFEGLFDGRAGGRWLSSRGDGPEGMSAVIRVDLKHVEEHIFAMVLRHMYADTGEEIFDDVVTADVDEFIDVILEVMAVSNELMLDRLNQVCQQVLGRHVTTRNICQLLNAVAACSVDEFKLTGLEYICLNLETMLEHRLLEELDVDLLMELDEIIQENQLACLRFARSGHAQVELFDRHPELAEQVEQGKQRTIDSLRLRSRMLDREGPVEAAALARERSVPNPVAMRSSPSKPSLRNEPAIATTTTTPPPPPPPPVSRSEEAGLEMVFDMDEDAPSDDSACSPTSRSLRHVHQPTNGPSGEDASPSSHPGPWRRGSAMGGESSLDAVVPSRSVPLHSGLSTSAGFGDMLDVNAASPPGGVTPSRPWQNRSGASPKTDLKSIMAHATASRTSSLTLAINQKAAGKAAPKLSQRQRKKIQHQGRRDDDMLSPEVKVDASERPVVRRDSSSPWQAISKDRTPLANEPSTETLTDPGSATSISRPTMTMRQTLAGASASRKQDGPSESPTQPRSVSGPSTGVPSSARPSIQSIRHTPVVPAMCSSPGGASHSMADILAQQQGEKRAIKEAAAKRSLQEIQQEQAFQEWWDHESKRVQEQAGISSATATAATTPAATTPAATATAATATAATATAATTTAATTTGAAKAGRARGGRRSGGRGGSASPDTKPGNTGEAAPPKRHDAAAPGEGRRRSGRGRGRGRGW